MDVLYTVGLGSKCDNWELRWSLRSLHRYARGVGKVIVVGYPPPWLSGRVVSVARPNLFKNRYWNILDSVLYAMEEGIVSGRFLWSSDDHFYTAPVDFSKPVCYHRRSRLPKYDPEAPGYNRVIGRTGDLLRANGLPDYGTNLHRNQALTANVLRNARRVLGPLWGGDAVDGFTLLSNMSQAVDPARLEVVRDVKFSGSFDRSLAVRNGVFSVGDGAFADGGFLDFMNGEFGEPSPYEKDAKAFSRTDIGRRPSGGGLKPAFRRVVVGVKRERRIT